MAIYSMGRRRVIVVLVLSSLLLITLDIRGNAAIDRLRDAFSLVIKPFDTAARTVSRPIVNAWRGVNDYAQLQRENELLRHQVDVQRGAEIEARAAILEFQELLVLNRLTGLSNVPTVTAQVQGAAPSNYSYTIEIDKGSIDGIAVGMPVVNGAGLVGKITKVFPKASVVLLITDPSFSVGVKVLTAFDPQHPGVAVVITPGGGVFSNQTTTSSSTSTSTSPTTTSTTIASSTTTAGLPTTVTSIAPPILDANGNPVDPGLRPDGVATSVAATTTTTTVAPFEVIRETGTLIGQGPGKAPVVRFVAASSTTGKLQVGSTVQTAGGNNSIAPAGLPVGTVSAVRAQSGSSVPIVEVELAAGDLTDLNFLKVLLYVPNSGSG